MTKTGYILDELTSFEVMQQFDIFTRRHDGLGLMTQDLQRPVSKKNPSNICNWFALFSMMVHAPLGIARVMCILLFPLKRITGQVPLLWWGSMEMQSGHEADTPPPKKTTPAFSGYNRSPLTPLHQKDLNTPYTTIGLRQCVRHWSSWHFPATMQPWS